MSTQSTNANEPISTDIRLIDPNRIDPNRFQPKTRITFTTDQLADLDSIREKGLLHEPRVRVSDQDPQRFECIDGWRRICKWKLDRPGEAIPVKIVARGDQAAFEEMSIENAQRAGLTMVEQAQVLAEYMRRYGETQERETHERNESRERESCEESEPA